MGGQWEIKCLECGKLIPREGKICPFCRSDKAPSIEAADAPMKELKAKVSSDWQKMKEDWRKLKEADANRGPTSPAAWVALAFAILAAVGAAVYYLSG